MVKPGAFVLAVAVAVAVAWFSMSGSENRSARNDRSATNTNPSDIAATHAKTSSRKPNTAKKLPRVEDSSTAPRPRFVESSSPRIEELKALYEKVVASVELTREQELALLVAFYDVQKTGEAIDVAIDPPDSLEELETEWAVEAGSDLDREFEARIVSIVGRDSFLRMNATYPVGALQLKFEMLSPLVDGALARN